MVGWLYDFYLAPPCRVYVCEFGCDDCVQNLQTPFLADVLAIALLPNDNEGNLEQQGNRIHLFWRRSEKIVEKKTWVF